MSIDNYTKPDWENSALLTIDVQEDFNRPGAEAYIPGTDEILPALRKLVQYYRDKNWPVFHVIRLYLRDGSNADLCRRSTIEQGIQIVAPGTDGADLVEELQPYHSTALDHELLLSGKTQQLGEQEWLLYKPRWGAFYQTNLEEMLTRRKINTVVLAGCNFPNCPRTTLYEASERDFRTVLAEDAVSGLYKKGEEELQGIGVSILNTSKIISNIQE